MLQSALLATAKELLKNSDAKAPPRLRACPPPPARRRLPAAACPPPRLQSLLRDEAREECP